MIYYLSLGANLGKREQTLQAAVQRIEQQIGHVLRCSSFYYSEPWGYTSDKEFCNLCCSVSCDQSPMEVLRLTQAIERELGRTKKSTDGIYSDRMIDIDLIRVFDDEKEVIMDTPELTLPHRLWSKRDFVKVPLAEIMQ